MRKTILLAMLATGTALPTAAQAATSTGSIAVSVSVQASCTIGSAALNFGTTGGGQADAAPTLAVTCTNATPFTIALDNGQGGAGATPEARILSATDGGGVKRTLTYSIYRDAGRTQVWGNTPANAYAGTGTGSQSQIPLYGRLFANASAVSGLTYSDTVAVTLTY